MDKVGMFSRHENVMLYVPNLIGYLRILASLYAFSVANTNPVHCVSFYFVSFACDELDGRLARKYNQTSTLGAVLDMVTDRVATTGLLAILCVVHTRFCTAFLMLMMLDIFSHWFHMYSTLVNGNSSHKDVQSGSWLIRMYYRHRLFMGTCCVCCEVLYLALYMLHWEQFRRWPLVKCRLPEQMLTTVPGLAAVAGTEGVSFVAIVAMVTLPGVVVKQICNVVQLKNAMEGLVEYDLARRQEPPGDSSSSAARDKQS